MVRGYEPGKEDHEFDPILGNFVRGRSEDETSGYFLINNQVSTTCIDVCTRLLNRMKIPRPLQNGRAFFSPGCFSTKRSLCGCESYSVAMNLINYQLVLRLFPRNRVHFPQQPATSSRGIPREGESNLTTKVTTGSWIP